MVNTSRLSLLAAASMVASASGEDAACALTGFPPKEVRHAVGVACYALQRSRGWELWARVEGRQTIRAAEPTARPETASAPHLGSC